MRTREKRTARERRRKTGRELSGWSVFLGDARGGLLFRDGHQGGDTEDQWERNEEGISMLASSFHGWSTKQFTLVLRQVPPVILVVHGWMDGWKESGSVVKNHTPTVLKKSVQPEFSD